MRATPEAAAAEKAFGLLDAFDPAAGETVVAAEATGAGTWAGAPSVLWDARGERILLAYRRRRPRGWARERGHTVYIAESRDGVDFRDVWQLRKEDVGARSLERVCLQRSRDGGYLLYTSYEHGGDGRWRIDVLEAASPERFDPAAARNVLTPTGVGVAAVKDPYVLRVGPAYLMLVSTFLSDAGPAPTALAVSLDGVRFDWRGIVFATGEGWDCYQARIGGILRGRGLFLGLYDGSAGPEEDTEERCGVALSADLHGWRRLSADGPWLTSPWASGSLRYVDALPVEGEWWLYYELALADGSHELRRSRVPRGA